MIETRNLRKSFGKLQVLKGIDIVLDRPGITAILGPNGSGKTTLIKCVLGMVLPDGGDILFNSEKLKDHWLYRDQISYLPQIARFPDNLRVRELLAMVKDLRQGRPANAERYIELFELEPHLDKRLGNLSGGTKQKVNLTLAFMFDCPMLIFDEPTAGLDPIARIKFKELLREARHAGKQIIITTHIMSLVEELADEIVFLLEGQIFFRGSVKDLEDRCGERNLERAIAKIMQYEIKQQDTPQSNQLNGQVPLSKSAEKIGQTPDE
jgi:Cu-processing system ATP-binding protein